MSHNNLVTHREVQALIWGWLKWVVLSGLGLAFAVGAWASEMRADVNRALEGTRTVEAVKVQVDSLRIEGRHQSAALNRIEYLLKRK